MANGTYVPLSGKSGCQNIRIGPSLSENLLTHFDARRETSSFTKARPADQSPELGPEMF
jgi:hypothetical protein